MQKSLPYLWPKWRQNSQNRYPIYDQNGWKILPFGAAHTYIAHIREYPPPPGKKYQFHLKENVYRNFHTNGKRSKGTSLASLVPIVEKWSLNALESSWFCISIVVSFNWGHFNSWEKLKTMLMQNFGVTSKEHYGMLWYFLEWSIGSELCSFR